MSSTVSSKKIIVEFPESLLKRVDKTATDLSTDRSKLIRTALEQYLAEAERLRLEQELAEGYAANAALDLRLCEDFAHLDGEGL